MFSNARSDVCLLYRITKPLPIDDEAIWLIEVPVLERIAETGTVVVRSLSDEILAELLIRGVEILEDKVVEVEMLLKDVLRLEEILEETESFVLRDVVRLEVVLEETELLVLRDVVRLEEILGETEMLGDVDTLEDILE